MAKLYTIGVLVLLLGALSFASYRYVVNLEDRLSEQRAKAEVLETVVRSQEQAIERIRQNELERKKLYESMMEDIAKTRVEVSKVTRIFRNHDFSKLLQAKPELIHNRMRRATDRLFLEFEEASRSE